MFTNYIKLAWRVLSRRKFFTFITLFGISFTLMILMLIISYLQADFGSRAPMGNQDQLIIMPNISLSMEYFDTIPTVDTTLIDGEMTLDTTYRIKSDGRSNSTSSFDKDLLINNFRGLESIEEETLFSNDGGYDVFVSNSKISIKTNYTDHHFWNIFNYKFIEGRPYGESEVERGAQVTVINDELAKKYFGRSENIIDKIINVDSKQYKVIGLVESAKLSLPFLTTGMFIPYTNAESSYKDPYFGGYTMVFHVKDGVSLQKAKGEIEHKGKSISPDMNPDYNELEVRPSTYPEIFASVMFQDEDEEKSLKMLKTVFFGLLALFILLPVLNLINLNVSRIMDRSSEIGVRKAFGATQKDILTQFVFENIVQTLLGGLIGLILVFMAIFIINKGRYLGSTQLMIDYKFFIYSLVICLLFGVLSGLLPAWRISKTHIVTALKSKQL